MKSRLRYNLVDVFTESPLSGNQLAVFTQGSGLTDDTMQSIAREMNLSETVFLFPPADGGHARLRIFTPRRELPFAGHPVLGSAWLLGQPIELAELRLETGAGIIRVELLRDGDLLTRARMTQPQPKFSAYESGAQLRAALGLGPPSESLLPPIHANNGPSHLLIEVLSPDELNVLAPDFGALETLTDAGVLVFAHGDDGCEARYFAPSSGIPEDPATGSAAGPLGAHLVQQGRYPSGQELVLHQGRKMQRLSTLYVEAKVDEGLIDEVKVAGAAVVIARGEMQLT